MKQNDIQLNYASNDILSKYEITNMINAGNGIFKIMQIFSYYNFIIFFLVHALASISP